MTTPASDSAPPRLCSLVRDQRVDGKRNDAGAVHFLHCRFSEIKAGGADDGKMRFSGYGAAFDNLDSYGDTIRKGAFKRTLREAKNSGVWPSMLSQHGGWGLTAQDLTPVGLWDSLEEDDRGLKAEGIFAPTPRGQELYELMKMEPRPAIDGLSIGFIARKVKINSAPKENEARREILDVDLIEVSIVSFPANSAARITGVKSRPTSVRELEAGLRTLGLSAREARRAASGAWSALSRGHADTSNELAAALRHAAERFAQTN